MKILTFPHPGLSARCTEVTSFDEALSGFADELLATMRAAPGVGMTAAHVGSFVRLFVLELPDWSQPRYYVNPVILETSCDMIRHTEGSVSMPGATEEVERPRRVRLSYRDLQGLAHEEEAEDFHAVCIQHEVDQLDGVFWLRRLSQVKRERLIRRWEKDTSRSGT